MAVPHPPKAEQFKVFISSKMSELRDARDIISEALEAKGLHGWVYEAHAGARPADVLDTSLREVAAADVYVGLFWEKYGAVTIDEYRYARQLGKPCFVYVRDKDLPREQELEDFLKAEVYDLQKGVTYDYFSRSTELAEQVARDIMCWVVRQHREMTAEIQAARVSKDEIARLQAEVDRLQAATHTPLPQGTPADYLALQMRGWFTTLSYGFESHEARAEDSFEWIIRIPKRRGYDRILVRGVSGEAAPYQLQALRQATEQHETDEGWLVAPRRVAQAVRDELEKRENRDLFCYTFDELLDQDADFDSYLDWLEAEIKRRAIERMYVPLACTKAEIDPATRQPLGQSRYDERNGWIDGYIDRWLDDPSKEHISILGEFGTGKTWFALHYAWTALQRYRDARARGVERPRLPLVISLRDYAKAVSVESLFSEFFFRKHEIPLPGYSAFEQLNRMGKLLLIFDGFDEMAARVDRQRMIDNFWELARVVVPGAKAILTCRTEHFPEAIEGRSLLNAELQASTAALTGEPPQFEVLELEKFDDDQIRQVLSFRADPATVEQVMSNEELLDLARRPVMTDLILAALPDIEAGKPVDLSRVYLYAVRRKMEQDITEQRTFTSLADKLYFLCELSWEMLSTNQMSLNYRHFPDRLRRLFGPVVQEQKDLDHWHYDMMSQTMLIRNAEGDYTPAHRSLLEFFVAYKFAAELGVLAPDFLELAQAQSSLDPAAPPQDYSWSSYFQRQVDANGEVKPIAPLREFATESMDKLVETVGKQWMSTTVQSLITRMVNIDRLIESYETWILSPSYYFVKNVLSVAKAVVCSTDLEEETLIALGEVVIRVLRMMSERMVDVNCYGETEVNIVSICLRILEEVPVEPFIGYYHESFFSNDLYYWKRSWLRFLGKMRIDILEKDLINSINEMDEVFLGAAIYYFADIGSRLPYERVVEMTKGGRTFLRPRALYYLWKVDQEKFYIQIRDLMNINFGKVLVSDSNRLISLVYQRLLKMKNINVIVEESPVEVINIVVNDEDISLIITDIHKPMMSGLRMIDQIRSIAALDCIPAIVASAVAYTTNLSLRPIKIDIVLEKPFDIETLLAAVNLLLLHDPVALEHHLRTSDPGNTIFQYLY